MLILEIPTTLIDYDSLDNRFAELMVDMINRLLFEVFAACAEFEMEKREKRQLTTVCCVIRSSYMSS